MICPFTVKVRNPRYKNLSAKELLFYRKACFNNNPIPDYYVSIPCGHCKYCLKRKRNDWRLRLLHEHTIHNKVLFITLSISPKHYDSFKNNPAPFIRRFLDNLRKKRHLFPNKSIKHWFITEGGFTEYDEHRFHFHGFLFGVTKKDLTYREIRSCWSYGHSWVIQSSPRICNYTTKYITKESDCPQSIFTSSGIGKCAVDKLVFDPHTYSFQNYFFAPNRPHYYPLPRYYKYLLFIPIEQRFSVLRARYNLGWFIEKYYVNGRIFTDLPSASSALSDYRSECLSASPFFSNWFISNKFLSTKFKF